MSVMCGRAFIPSIVTAPTPPTCSRRRAQLQSIMASTLQLYRTRGIAINRVPTVPRRRTVARASACRPVASATDAAPAASAEGLKVSRRQTLAACSSLVVASGLLPSLPAIAASDAPGPKLLADLPMIRLKLPQSGVGNDFAAVQLTVAGKGPYRFMVDSGLTAELITPHLQQELGIPNGSATVAGLGAGGLSAPAALVTLRDAELCCGEFPDGKGLPLPPLNAAVMDFPQEHIDPNADPVEGMLGMEMLALFDADLDFPKGRIRLWAPGSAAQIAANEGLAEVPAAVLNETGVIGIRAAAVPGPFWAKQPSQQPFVGIVDCGASFTTLNVQAARLLGLPLVQGPDGVQLQLDSSAQGPTLLALGVDGKPVKLPTTTIGLTFKGNSVKGEDGRITFEPPPKGWQPWKPVTGAVGDLPAFSQLLGDGRTPFKGPAALIGLDILSQRRVILEAVPPALANGAGAGRRRRLFISKS